MAFKHQTDQQIRELKIISSGMFETAVLTWLKLQHRVQLLVEPKQTALIGDDTRRLCLMTNFAVRGKDTL